MPLLDPKFMKWTIVFILLMAFARIAAATQGVTWV